MTETAHSLIMRRMTRQLVPEVAAPLTSSRALRMALVKTAHDSVGLALTVTSMAEEAFTLDDLLAEMDENLMLVELRKDGRLVGFTAVDVQLRAAIIEMQTVGQLIAAGAEDRQPTNTDKMMCDAFLAAFLAGLPTATLGTSLEGWIDAVEPAGRLADARAAGLVLADQTYRLVRLNVDLGVADRQGGLMVALPFVLRDAPVVPDTAPDASWDRKLETVVMDAPANLNALLHRFSIPLSKAQALQVGDRLPLPGCTVSSVQLLARDGKTVAQAKLGQAGGHRAVRIEAPPGLELAALAAVGTDHGAVADPLLEVDPSGAGMLADDTFDEGAMSEPGPIGGDFGVAPSEADEYTGFPAIADLDDEGPMDDMPMAFLDGSDDTSV